MVSPCNPRNLDVGPLLGPFAIEALVCAMILGITLVQSKEYFEACGRDPTLLVLSVVFLWILHVFHNVCMSHTMYHFLVTNFGDYSKIPYPPWSFGIGATITGITSFVVQTYYARQVYVLGGRRLLIPIGIVALALLSSTFAFVSTVRGYQLGDFRRFNEAEYSVLTWLVSAGVCDVLLSASLVYYLRQHRQATVFKDTRSLLAQVITNTVENNLLTCIVVIVDCVLFGLYRQLGNWHIILNGMLVGLYFTSLLTSLNARHRFAEQREDVRYLSKAVNQPTCERPVISITDHQGPTHSLSPITGPHRASQGLIQVIRRASLSATSASSKRKGSAQSVEGISKGGGAMSPVHGDARKDVSPSAQFALYRIQDDDGASVKPQTHRSSTTQQDLDPLDDEPNLDMEARVGTEWSHAPANAHS
ncbi:hypothetical protein OIO90_001462 [Microbotryomycetes sp. JL221]|nr:hypothetical protein OIO90_001462 [Microbotryomycetes sp. JL221]